MRKSLAQQLMDLYGTNESNLVAVVKASDHNKKVLKKIGLGSKDPSWFYTMYQDVMDGKDYEFKELTNSSADKDYLMRLADKHGLKF